MNSAHPALLVEDQIETRAWLAAMLREAFPGIVVHECADLKSARLLIASVPRWRLVLVDIGLPDGSGIDLVRELQARQPETPAIVTTIYDDDDNIFKAIAAGAQGYLLKAQPHALLLQQLQRLDEGVPPLSPSVARRMLNYFHQKSDVKTPAPELQLALSARETEVLTCIGRGLRISETAQRLGLTESTVASYVKTLYRKLNIRSRAEAALEAVRRGLA